MTLFCCSVCRHVRSAWSHRCGNCGETNVYAEMTPQQIRAMREAMRAAAQSEAGETEEHEHVSEAMPIGKIDTTEPPRVSSGDEGLDHVLGGGGFVPGGAIALYGSPGVGKSSLLTKVGMRVGHRLYEPGNPHASIVLYATGEEDQARVARRARRFGLFRTCPFAFDRLRVMEDMNDTQKLIEHIVALRPLLTIVDSLSTLVYPGETGAPNSPSQVLRAAQMLREVARMTDSVVVYICHENKDGGMAGPRTVQHDCDALLVLEHVEARAQGVYKHSEDQTGIVRLKAKGKNRNGDTAAFALYRMGKKGLLPFEETDDGDDDDEGRSTADSGRARTQDGGAPATRRAARPRSASRLERPVRTREGDRAAPVRERQPEA